MNQFQKIIDSFSLKNTLNPKVWENPKDPKKATMVPKVRKALMRIAEEFIDDLGEDVCVILPLYLYDHSGITMNTTGFSCPWDSGQVGWVFVSKKKVREEYGVKRITESLVEKVTEILKGEVKTYDMYLTGELYEEEYE